ncbi:hypothetical protein [Saccharopolyspora sp. NPDC002376]
MQLFARDIPRAEAGSRFHRPREQSGELLGRLREQLARKYIGKSREQHITDTPAAGADRGPVTAVRITLRKVVSRL